MAGPLASCPRRLRLFVGAGALAALGGVWHRVVSDAMPPRPPGAIAAPAVHSPRARAASPPFAAGDRERTHALDLAVSVARNADERYQLISRLLPELAATNPSDAWHWAARHNAAWSESGQATLTELVLARLATDAPDQVNALVLGDDQVDPERVDQGVAALLQARHVAAARALVENWSRQATTESTDGAAFERIAFVLAQSSPAESASWLLALPSSPGRDAGLGVVADVWAATDAPAAMAWAETLPSIAAREAAVERAFARWVERDSDSALQWLVVHEAAADTDRLIARWLAVSEKIRAQPGAAPAWLALIRDPALRVRSAERFSRR